MTCRDQTPRKSQKPSSVGEVGIAFFGADSLAEVGVALQKIEMKDDLQKRAKLAAGDILNVVCSPTLDKAEQALDATDRAALETEFIEGNPPNGK